MCLMKTLTIRFSTWEAFDRAIQEVKANYGDKLIFGEIYLPTHERFKNWEQFNKAVDAVSKHAPQTEEEQKRNDACPGIYGEFVVEITWGMIR